MNQTLKGWLLGLVAAIVSAVADAGVLFLVAPEVLHDVKKFGLLLGFSALKGLFLYLQKSPMPNGVPLATKVTAGTLLVVLLGVGMTGCDSWERQTYQTLAASQKVVNQARDDYRTGKIAQTMTAYTVINRATDVQTSAVEMFAAYERAKIVATPGDAQKRQAEVAALLVQLPDLIKSIEALYHQKVVTPASGGAN